MLQTESPALRYGTTTVVISPIVNDRLRRTLVELRRREHGVTLVTLGDVHLDQALPGVRTYHIGGGELWRELEKLELA